MPLIDEQTIESLRLPDGSFSQFALYLLYAVPLNYSAQILKGGKVNQHAYPLPSPDPDWQQKVLCTRISKVHLRTIKGEAKRIARMRKRFSNDSGAAPKAAGNDRTRGVGRSLRASKPSGSFTPASVRCRPNHQALKLMRRVRRKLITGFKKQMDMVERTIDLLKNVA